MIRTKKDGQIYRNIWFGHFYRPAYDDQEFVRRSCALLRELGFNSVLLDTKDWQDFRDRFVGGPASQYVRMHEYMQKSLADVGLTHAFLALYLNGDNLYPAIRFSPPVYGESVVGPDGKDGKWYRYWSVKARETMVEHVAQLMENYGSNHTIIEVNGQERKPLCSMWDPIVAPSFDREGKARYLSWLEKKYANDVEALNSAYGLCADSFMELKPEEYWYACRYPGRMPTEEMLREKESGARIWADNQCWRREELEDYFADMQRRLHALDPSLYLVPDMAQWGYFLNIHGSALTGADMSDLWDTAVRGIDLWPPMWIVCISSRSR